MFDHSAAPNSDKLSPNSAQPQFVTEFEERHQLPRCDRQGTNSNVQQHHRGVGVPKSALDVSSPVANASAAALISDWACARATAARAVASPDCADVASVNVPTPCA